MESSLEALWRVLPAVRPTRALLRIDDRAWLYDSDSQRFLTADGSIMFDGTVLSFPGGTLILDGRISVDTQQVLQVWLDSMAELVRTRQLLGTVFKTSLALSANLHLKNLLSELMRLTREALGTEVGSVMLLDDTKSNLYWELAEGDETGVFERRSLSVGQGIAGTVAKTGESIIVADAGGDPRVARWVDEATSFRTRSILCVPVRFRGEIIGVLQALNKIRGTFTKQDQEVLELMAAEAGVAIENARLYGTLEQRVQERTSELSETNAHLSRTLDELKATQVQLVQSEKMAALGKLVAGVAHEINTPLGSITSNTDLLGRGFKKLSSLVAEEGRHVVRMLESLLQTNAEAARRIAGIVKNLKTFARLDEAERKYVDLREAMDSTLALVHHLHKDRIEMIREYREIPLVECQPGQINQVFMNLLVNAIQAIQGPGTIRIRMQQQGETVSIAVHDSGVGIAQDHLAKIFDPGFTTKGVGVGTGLGLSICHQIISSHHGTIQVTSQKGAGSTFTVFLPLRHRKG